MRETLLLLMPLGSEVRQFGHAGLITRMLDAGWRVVVAAKIVDDDLRRQLDSRVELLQLPLVPRPFFLARVTAILDKAIAVRKRRSGTGTWQYQGAEAKNWKERVLFLLEDVLGQLLGRFVVLYDLGLRIEKRLRNSFEPVEWRELIDTVAPRVVLTNAPSIKSLDPGLQVASRSGSRTVLIYHTWKDLLANGRFSHNFFNIGVWNEDMRSEFMYQNPGVAPNSVEIVGCAHFDCVGRDDLLAPEKVFRKELGCRADSQIVFYPASAPWVVPEEERYIITIWQWVLSELERDNVELVVRLNPMDQTKRLSRVLQGVSRDIHVVKPDWRWERQQNWCFQRKSDVSFYNNLLAYSSVCVGIASTVTVECAVARLPVINIGFDLPGPLPMTGNTRDFWEARFYEGVRESGAAVLAKGKDEFVGYLLRSLSERSWMSDNQEQFLRAALGVQPGGATSRSLGILAGRDYAGLSQGGRENT